MYASQDPIFSSFGYIPRSWIIELCDNCIFTFFELLHTFFHSCCIILQFFQQCIYVIISLIHSNTYYFLEFV
jgi:hypothetical protein